MNKGTKIFLIVVTAILGIIIILMIASKIIYSRSLMASVAEVYIKSTGIKEMLSDEEKFYISMEKKIKNQKEYELPNVNIKSNIEELFVNDNKVYRLYSDGTDKIIIYIHGGGYISEAESYHIKFVDRLVDKTGAEVYFPIYPLAPRHQYKEAYDMILELYGYLANRFPQKEIILMGDSAGGGLALGFTEYLNEIKLNMKNPDKIVLLSPWLDATMSNENIKEYEKVDPMLSTYGLVESGKLWAGEDDTTNYLISPINGELINMPKILMFVGTREIFYPDVTLLNEKLKENKQDVKLVIGIGLNHGSPLYPIPEANTAIWEIIDFIQK